MTVDTQDRRGDDSAAVSPSEDRAVDKRSISTASPALVLCLGLGQARGEA